MKCEKLDERRKKKEERRKKKDKQVSLFSCFLHLSILLKKKLRTSAS